MIRDDDCGMVVMIGQCQGVVMVSWSKVSYERCGKKLGDLARVVPYMNLKEVDETLEWMGENWAVLKQGKKMVWGKLKRRQEELLGRKLGGDKPRPGPVVVLTVDQAKLMDEVRMLRECLRAAGHPLDSVV